MHTAARSIAERISLPLPTGCSAVGNYLQLRVHDPEISEVEMVVVVPRNLHFRANAFPAINIALLDS